MYATIYVILDIDEVDADIVVEKPASIEEPKVS